MNEKIQQQDEGNPMGTIILMLGLYLIILAFFILLNTMAVISDEKVTKASKSVSEGFGFRAEGSVKVADTQEIAMEVMFETIATEIKELMESHISIRNFDVSQNSEKMVIRVKTDQFFDPGYVNIRPEMGPMFIEMARVFTKPREGTRMIGNVLVHGTREDVGVKGWDVLDLAGRRSALLTRALINQGVPKEDIQAIAVEDGATAEVEFRFTVKVDDQTTALDAAMKDVEKRGGF